MIRRPLAVISVVFILLSCLRYTADNSFLSVNPEMVVPDGIKDVSGINQDEKVSLYGVIADYSFRDNFSTIATELILKDVHILIPDRQSGISTNKLPHTEIKNYKKISSYGQSVIVYVNKEERVAIGNTVLISGQISYFEPASNPGQFDSQKYYANKDVLFAVEQAEIEGRTKDRAYIRQGLKEFGIKQQEKLEIYLKASDATIMKAMLFGNKEELDEEIKKLYQDNGIAHLLAISGLHISLLGMAVYRLLQRLPFPVWISLVLSEIFLILYGFMVGFSASAFRAIGMFTFMLFSKVTKRSYDMITAVSFIALLQLLIHPGYLFDCGFQLSYGAILGIGILLPALEKINRSIPIGWLSKIISLLLPSLSVSLVTMPILIWHYHEISFFSILLNVIVIPFMSVLLLCTIAMLFFSNFWVFLAKIFSLPVILILNFYEYSCRFLELFPLGQLNIASPPIIVLLLYFLLLFLVTTLVKIKSHYYQFLFVGVAIVILFYPQNPQFNLWITDVGQGDSSVIFTKEGKCFVIDCGSTSDYRVGERILIPFLKYHGIGQVDAVFVTHADADHMNGVVELLKLGREENIRVSCVVLYEKALETEPEEWSELVVATEENKIPIVRMKQGDIIGTDSVKFECLYPLKEQSNLTGNASSLVLSLTVDMDNQWVLSKDEMTERGSDVVEDNHNAKKVEKGYFRVLFPGDLEEDGERAFCEEYEGFQLGQYDLLKVGHHGSSGSSSGQFLKWVAPKWAAISCGENNRYGHPHVETLERLKDSSIAYYMTYEKGAMCFNASKGTVSLCFYEK